MSFKEITLLHATWKNPATGGPIEVLVRADQIFAAFFLPSANATAVMGPGGVHLVVLETSEEVMNRAKAALYKGEEE